MRIAVTFEDGKIFRHFGHSKAFKVYDVNEGKIQESKLVEVAEGGHGAIAGLLKESEVDAVICSGIGEGAQIALAEAGIELYAGVSGDCDEAVEKLLAKTLEYSKGANCSHHSGEHKCGHHKSEHGGEHKCGHHKGEHSGEHKCKHHK